jgi:hypothetical protein
MFCCSQTKNKVIISLFLFFQVFLLATQAEAQEYAGEAERWRQLATDHTIIQYQSEDHLRAFDKKIDFGDKHWGFTRLFYAAAHDAMQKRLQHKVDALFERVQEVLDMKRKMPKVVIRLYPDKKELHDIYVRMYEEPCQVRAWYRYKNNTVYLTVIDLNEGMLAHELAHAVMDHYLLVRPPAASAEILARYVDTRLQR